MKKDKTYDPNINTIAVINACHWYHRYTFHKTVKLYESLLSSNSA